MQRSTLGRLRAQGRTSPTARTRTVPVQRVEIMLVVVGLVLGPGDAQIGPDRFAVPARTVREGLLYLAVDGILGGPAEIVLDDGSVEWDGHLPGRDVLLLGSVQGDELHLHRAIDQRAAEPGADAAPPVRTVAEILDGRSR